MYIRKDDDEWLQHEIMRSMKSVSDLGVAALRELDEEYTSLQDAIARNLRKRARVQAQQDQKLAMGEDVFSVGDVIRWTKRFTDRLTGELGSPYTYAALKISNTEWSITGTTQKRMTWAGLLAFMIARGKVDTADVMRVDRSLIG